MSQPVVLTWLPSNTTYVAPTQTLTAAGPLQLNATEGWATPGCAPNSYGQVTIPDFERVISITATAVLSVAITGISINGQAVSENLATINGIVYSLNRYHTVTSIVTNGAAVNISAGIGVNSAITVSGRSNYTLMDFCRGTFYGAIQLNVLSAADTVGCNIYQSLDKPYIISNGTITQNTIIQQSVPTSITNPIVADQAVTNLTTPITMLWLEVQSATTTSAGSFIFTVLQQGIT